MNLQPQQTPNAFDPVQLVKRILQKWYYILACVLLFLGIAFFVNRYAAPKYQVVTTIQVNKESFTMDPLDLLFNRNTGGKPVNLMDETVLLSSVPLLLSTIQELDFAVSYYDENPLSLIELYKDSPLEVSIDASSTDVPYGQLWKIELVNEKQFKLHTEEKVYQLPFDRQSEVEGFVFTVNLNDPEKFKAYQEITFRVNRLFDVILEYREKLIIQQVFEQSTVLNLTVEGQNVEKETDFLNMLTEKVLEQDMRQKRANSERTVEFIDQQLNENSDSLQLIEGDIRKFKNEKVPVDPGIEGNQLYANIRELKNQKANILLNDEYYDYLLESLNQQEGLDEIVVPSAMGVQDPILSQLISRLVNLQLDVKLLMSDNKSKNPLLQEKQQTIAELKSNILTNVRNLKATSQIRLKDIDQRIQLFASSLQEIPEAEQQLVNIQRDYRVNEELYLLLMQKRLEAGINAAAINSDYRIVNRAFNAGMISASPLRNYSIALLLGLILPVGIMLILDFMSEKIRSKEEISQFSKLPVVASILHQENPAGEFLHTPAFESFRSLRANLRYLHQPTQVLMFTSSISGEGKSFCSRNLAQLLSMTSKKTLWIDADLRKPSTRHHKEKHGLSSYLAGFAPAEAVLTQGKNPFFSMISAGKLPPNPAELLVSERMKELITNMREHFDYIIIDTPPLGVFSDAMELLPLADHSFLLVRQKHSQQTPLKTTSEMIQARGISHVSIIYNDVKDKKGAYGYQYAYYQNGKASGSKKKKVKT